MITEIREKLIALQDLKYRDFHRNLCPGLDNMIGVRIPELRKLAKSITKQDFRQFLADVENESYEETMIEGIVIATAPMAVQERLQYVKKFIPKIDNWAVCDCVAASFRFKSEEKGVTWDFLRGLKQSEGEFELRFMLVMFLDYFLEIEYLDEILKIVNGIKSDKYYVNMATAWLLAEMFTLDREKVIRFLRNNRLSDFTHNKAIQKARESYRVTKEDKAMLLGLKRM